MNTKLIIILFLLCVSGCTSAKPIQVPIAELLTPIAFPESEATPTVCVYWSDGTYHCKVFDHQTIDFGCLFNEFTGEPTSYIWNCDEIHLPVILKDN